MMSSYIVSEDSSEAPDSEAFQDLDIDEPSQTMYDSDSSSHQFVLVDEEDASPIKVADKYVNTMDPWASAIQHSRDAANSIYSAAAQLKIGLYNTKAANAVATVATATVKSVKANAQKAIGHAKLQDAVPTSTVSHRSSPPSSQSLFRNPLEDTLFREANDSSDYRERSERKVYIGPAQRRHNSSVGVPLMIHHPQSLAQVGHLKRRDTTQFATVEPPAIGSNAKTENAESFHSNDAGTRMPEDDGFSKSKFHQAVQQDEPREDFEIE